MLGIRDGVSRHCGSAECVHRNSQGHQRRRAAGRHRRSLQPGADRRHASPPSPTPMASTASPTCRPGVYTVTFTLPGFKQQRLEKVELRVDFVGTLNGTLEVGAIEEAITVTGASPTVDVSSNSKVEVMTARDPRAGADRPDHPGAGAAGQRRLAQRPRRRRLARDAADLHVDARPHLGQQHRHRRRPDGQRPRRRRRGAAVLQPVDDGRDVVPDERRRRRRLAGRRPHEHRAQGRRQPLQRRRSSRPGPTRRGRATT